MNKIIEAFKKLLKSRSFKYGTNSIVLVAGVLAIAVFINVLVGLAPLKLDLTPNKLFSISDTTKTIIKGLKEDVKIYGLFDDSKASTDPEIKEMTEVLNQYGKYSHISVRYVNPDKNPGILTEIDPNNPEELKGATFAVKFGNKVKKLTSADLYEIQYSQDYSSSQKTGSKIEEGFTGAIKYVTAAITPTIYFTEGHNENKVDSDYATVKTYLDKNNYAVKTVNLLTQEKVPADTEILVVASPKKDLSTDEKVKIETYLKMGGKAIFLFDSLEPETKFEKFENLLGEYGIGLDYDKVKENDQNRHAPQNEYDILPDVQQTDINAYLNPSSFTMVMPTSRSISILKNTKQYLTVTSLMKTSDKAVGVQIDKSRGADIKGPLDLAVAAQYQVTNSKSTKILVMGNALFMSDSEQSHYSVSQNGLVFFLNALNWMQDKKDVSLVQPKTYDYRMLNITQGQANTASVVLVVVVPLLILALGLFVWMRRRHL